MIRKNYKELKKELKSQLRKADRIKNEIGDRFDFLYEKYKFEVLLMTDFTKTVYENTEDSYFYKLEYIRLVEEYLESKNNYKQLNIFDE